MFWSLFLNDGWLSKKSGPLRRLIALVLVQPLLFSSGNADLASAGGGPSMPSAPATQSVHAPQPAPVEIPSEPEEPNPAKILIREDPPEVKKGVDKVHDRIEQRILGELVRFDSFFGDFKSEDDRKTGYQLQVRNFVRVKKGGG